MFGVAAENRGERQWRITLDALIDHYADQWNWEWLSGNEGLPWSEALIDRYAKRWNWEMLSKNKGLPWSNVLYERFAERWDVWSVVSQYDGNVRSLTPEQVDRLMRD
jgi:hypothetical protein